MGVHGRAECTQGIPRLYTNLIPVLTSLSSCSLTAQRGAAPRPWVLQAAIPQIAHISASAPPAPGHLLVSAHVPHDRFCLDLE